MVCQFLLAATVWDEAFKVAVSKFASKHQKKIFEVAPSKNNKASSASGEAKHQNMPKFEDV